MIRPGELAGPTVEVHCFHPSINTTVEAYARVGPPYSLPCSRWCFPLHICPSWAPGVHAAASRLLATPNCRSPARLSDDVCCYFLSQLIISRWCHVRSVPAPWFVHRLRAAFPICVPHDDVNASLARCIKRGRHTCSYSGSSYCAIFM